MKEGGGRKRGREGGRGGGGRREVGRWAGKREGCAH